MRLVETRTSHERVEQIMAAARIERSRAVNEAVRALGRAIAGAFHAARRKVRGGAGGAEQCRSC